MLSEGNLIPSRKSFYCFCNPFFLPPGACFKKGHRWWWTAPVRIVHIIRTERGGGHNAATRLRDGLLQQGHESMLLVAETQSEEQDQTIRKFAPHRDAMSRLRRRFRRRLIARDRARYLPSRPADADSFSDDRGEHGAEVLDQIPSCDVVTIHSMNDFFDWAVLPILARRVPIVAMLHDMAFFTGGCHYDQGCGKFADRCGACPQLGSRESHDLSRQIWLRKRSAFNAIPRGRLWFVAPSRWIAEEMRRSSLACDFPVTVIHPGVDTEVFRPRDRLVARDVFGLPVDARVVLFVCDWRYRPHKGFAVLAEALRGTGDIPNLILVSVGRAGGGPVVEVQIPHTRLHTYDERLLSFVYSAADILVIPSLQEVYGIVVSEAMACGVPVVGSDVGGISEQVRPGVTGLLVPAKDSAALRDAMRQLLKDPAMRAEMSIHARRIASEERTPARQVHRFTELCDAILSDRRLGP